VSAPRPTELAQLAGAGLEVTESPPGSGLPDGLALARPRSEEEVSVLMRLATQHGWAVTVRGQGTKSAWGPDVERCDLVLDTTGLNQLVEHEPGDLICVAGAGMRLSELQELTSRAHGYRQRLMLDPPGSDAATLGGLVATRAAGPLRTRYGTMRDLLLGARFVLADGTIAKTGGKVVKNVAGYDLDKLLVGSLGTLAVVVEVALRLHPQAEARESVLLEGVDSATAAKFLIALRAAPAVPSVAEALWPEGAVLVQIDGTRDGAIRQAELVAELDPRARVLDLAEASYWEEVLRNRPWDRPGVVLGVSVPLSATRAVLDLVADTAIQEHAVALSLRGTIGCGELRVAASSDKVEGVRREVERLGGQVEVHRAEPELRGLGSRPRDPLAGELMAAVKQALDPGHILAPGRLEGLYQTAASPIAGAAGG
jgi:glycolate oxidase FAD binding subunit